MILLWLTFYINFTLSAPNVWYDFPLFVTSAFLVLSEFALEIRYLVKYLESKDIL